ncbi:MAG: DUF454 domain-containing protein [Ignavibacteria bacterium]|nr:MAG: DUF454 domain-containing protein [Ignavibacteria bacterium]
MMKNNPLMKHIYLVLGFICVGLGIIGVFLPIMPTTIFMIIAAYFFSKSNPELRERLFNNKYIGSSLRRFYTNYDMPLRAKIAAISLLNVSIFVSIFYIVEHLYIQLILFLTTLFVTLIILAIKTREPLIDE